MSDQFATQGPTEGPQVGQPTGAAAPTAADEFLAQVTRSRLLGIIRGTDADAAVAAALALFEEGVRLVEVALTTPRALEVIERIRAQVPSGASIGAGTVLAAEDVAAVEAAGAQFIVTPAVVPSIEEAARRGLPVAAGALSPTEAHLARLMGATAIKLFPASSGGPRYLRALRDPFPDIPFLAVGGVGLTEAVEYLAAGAVGVGVGGPLVGDAASGGDLAGLRERARAFVSLVSGGSTP
jgi:2-dehydro-3-deoxyphosphogluconate aldolase/(4S)-4-hydroxy-2-oxoglutarate aldolase